MIGGLILVSQLFITSPYRLVMDYAKVPIHSKVCTVGRVVYRRKMVGDNDWHITIIDSKGQKLVLEIIPEIPIEPPVKGQDIIACGIGRYDIKHKWPEIHPLLKWRLRTPVNRSDP